MCEQYSGKYRLKYVTDFYGWTIDVLTTKTDSLQKHYKFKTTRLILYVYINFDCKTNDFNVTINLVGKTASLYLPKLLFELISIYDPERPMVRY